MRRCLACGEPLPPKPPGQPGPLRSYCCANCRVVAFRRRHRRSLGEATLREWGIPERPSLLERLREQGTRGPFA